MTRPSNWRGALVLIIVLVIVAQGLLNAMRPIIGWLIGLAVIVVIALLVIKKLLRW